MSQRLLLLYGLHSVGSLAVEVALLKCAGLLFGLDLPGAGTVLAVYIAGTATGAMLADKLPRAWPTLYLFAGIQTMLGALAVAAPEVLRLADSAFLGLATGLQGGLLHIVRIPTVAIATVPLAVLIGAVFPVLAREAAAADTPRWFPRRARGGGGRARHRDLSGRSSSALGLLYTVGTLASAAGALAGAIWLIPAAGSFGALRWVGAFFLANAAFALMVARMRAAVPASAQVATGSPRVTTASAQMATASGAARSAPEPTVRLPRRIGALAFALGAALFASEVAWLQLMWLVVDPTPYVTGTTLAVVIVCMGVGAAVAVRALGHGVAATGVTTIGITGAALATAGTMWFGARPAAWVLASTIPGDGFGGYLLSVGLMAVGVLGPAAAFHGAAAAGILGVGFEALRNSPRAASRIAALQAAGNAAGALAASFVLVPRVGLAGALAVCVVLLLAAQVLLKPGRLRARRPQLVALGAAVVALVLIAPVADPVGGAGSSGRIVFHREDGTGVTEVWESDAGHRTLVSNRLRQEGGDAPRQQYLELLQGYVPLLSHPSPRKVLVVGLGTGISLAPFRSREVEKIVCVEISPVIVEAAAGWFQQANRRILQDPRVTVVVADGRSYMRRETATYDLIVQELFFPYASGTSALYTLEHYRALRERLRPGGVAAQWISLAQAGTPELRTLVATFQTVFPETHLFAVGGYLALLGSEQPLRLDPSQLAGRIARGPLREDLVFGPIESVADFLALYVTGPEGAKSFAGEAPLQTDNRLRIEYAAPLRLAELNTTGLTVRNLTALRAHLAAPGASIGTGEAHEPNEGGIVDALAARGPLIDGIAARFRGDMDAAIPAYERAYRLHPNQPQARAFVLDRALTAAARALELGELGVAELNLRRVLSIEPHHLEARLDLAVVVAQEGRDAEALSIYEALLQEHPDLQAAHYNAGLSSYRLGRFERAAEAFRQVLRTDPAALDASFHLANCMAQLGRFERAAELYRSVLKSAPEHQRARSNLAQVERAAATRGLGR